jgi:glutamate/tyrosine decarboxylase-like PLP-dependent enzyme
MTDFQKTETLDPENWDEFKQLGYKMIDDITHSLQNDSNFKYSFPDEEVINNIYQPLGKEGEGEQQTYQAYIKYIEPYSMGKCFGRSNYWGWVVGSGSPYGSLIQMLMGHLIASGEQEGADVHVHKQTINWIKEMLDFPKTASGVIVNGGSEANFTGLAVARNAKAKVDMKAKGVQNVPKKMVCYVSEEGHHCLERSVELIGLGNENLRWIKTSNEYQIDLTSLKKAIQEDRENGYHPFCVIGNAGTVNTGAFDDFNALADIAATEDMWFHVDGAFGSWIKLSDTHRGLADGLERADSLAVDLHKWMNMPYGIGCTLVQDKIAHHSTFVYGHEADYLKTSMDMIDEQGQAFDDATMLSLALSRNYSSLKAYMLLRAYGKDKYSRLVQQNLEQISYFGDELKKTPLFEVTAPIVSNIVCFRYKPEGLSEDQVEELNKKIRDSLYETQFGVVSDTVTKGVFSLRTCNVSYRSRNEDFDNLIKDIIRIGKELAP